MARLSGWILLLTTALGCPAPQATKPPYPAPKTAQGGKLIAQVGPVAFTTEEIESRIKQQSPFVRVQLRDLEKRQLFVRDQIRSELLAQEAWARGLYDDPRVQAEIRKLMVQQVMKDHLQSVRDEVEVSETEFRQAYRDRHDEFNKPAKVRLSQIVRYVDDKPARAEAKKLLERVKTQVIAAQRKNDHKAFGAAAREHSEDENTKLGEGDLQFLTREQLAERYGDQVAGHMFENVNVGDLVIADAPNAVVLFKKTGSRRAVERTLEQVKPQIRAALIGEKRTKTFEAFVAELQKRHNVQIDEGIIAEVKVDMKAPAQETK